jgi:hypothetical protein
MQGFGRPLPVTGLHASALHIATEAITQMPWDSYWAPSLALSMLSSISNIGLNYKQVCSAQVACVKRLLTLTSHGQCVPLFRAVLAQ